MLLIRIIGAVFSLQGKTFKMLIWSNLGFFYKKPARNFDVQGNNTTRQQTKVLNDTGTVVMVHLYSSRNPLDDI